MTTFPWDIKAIQAQMSKSLNSALRVGLSVGAISYALFSGLPSQAVIFLQAEQVGSDVVIKGSGTANLSALSLFSQDFAFQNVFTDSQVYAGPSVSDGDVDLYDGILTGPTIISTKIGVVEEPDPASSSGDLFGIQVNPYRLVLPLNYVSNTQLQGTSVYKNLTLSDLGLTPGVGTWTWGSQANGTFDSINLNVVPGPLPIAGAAITLGWSRKLRRRITAGSKK